MNNGMNKILDGFVGSYIERDKTTEFSDWLSKRIQQNIPDMPTGESDQLSKEIIEAVAQYDLTLADVNKAVEEGQSKEEWLANHVAEAYSGIKHDEAGNKLQQVYGEMVSSNAALMGEVAGAVTVDYTEVADWNEFSLKDKALNIGKQAVMAGLGVAADTIRLNTEQGSSINSEMIALALQDGAASREVKAVVAGAVKVAAENKLANTLPSDTPIETICDIAGVAVEGAEAMFDIATGKSTVVDALDRAGRASVAAVSRWCANFLQGTIFTIPVIGPFAAVLTNGLFERMRAPKFAQDAYNTVRNVAVSTWEGIKQTARGIKNFVANKISNWLFNG